MAKPRDIAREKLWGRALADGLRYALYLTHDKSRAEELAADAVAAALDPDRSPWNPDGEKTPSQHVVYLIRMGLKDAAAKARVRRDPANAGAVADWTRKAAPRPDARLTAEERHERGEARWHEIREGLDPFDRRVLDTFGEDLKPAEQARRLGVDVSKIYEARREIAARIRALPPEDDGERSDTAVPYLCDGPDDEDAEDEVVQ